MIIERLVTWMEVAPLDKKVKAASVLVRAWHSAAMSDEDRDAAEAAMTCILDDPDMQVRVSLSEAIADLANPPRHLVLALAADSEEVSLPILSHCSALLDIELIHMVNSGTDEQQKAIASRPVLSATVCATLAKEGCKNACLALVTNPEAHLNRNDFYAIAERHGDCAELRSCMLVRHDIGMRARLLLIECYAASLVKTDDDMDAKQLIRKEREIQEVCDKATITFAAQITDQEIHEMVHALIARQKLTTSFLLRAICMGNLSLFAHSLAVLADQPLHRVERILKERRSNGLHAIYSKAGLPMSALTVFCSAIATWRFYLEAENAEDPERMPYLVTREILSNYEGKRDHIVDELLMLLRKICTETARDNARSKVERLSVENQPKIALPAPEEETVSEVEPETIAELPQEDLMAFTLQFAEELAELAIQADEDLALAAEELVADNSNHELAADALRAFSSTLDRHNQHRSNAVMERAA
jgi:uncharacterized protein (DUF2336 family)